MISSENSDDILRKIDGPQKCLIVSFRNSDNILGERREERGERVREREDVKMRRCERRCEDEKV